jgi:hypothetical protein
MKPLSKRIAPAPLPFLRDRSVQILLTAVVLAFLVSGIFYFTYPINIGQSDNASYVRMIVLGSSNLMHASGYPAVIHFLSQPIMPPYSSPIYVANDANNLWFSTLQTVQFLLHLALFSVSIVLCAKLFGKSAATIVALGWGCNVLFVSNVNATAPEWIQGHSLLLAVLIHAYARKSSTKAKSLFYCIGAAVFALAYLIKPNSLLMAFCLAAFLLFEAKSWRFKALQASASAAIFLLLTAAYANTYHYKSTGTTQLNFDHAWVLTAALPSKYFSEAPERLGINSLRWSALSRVTPPDYSRAGSVEHIDFGAPANIRNQYEEYTEHIFRMSREELLQFVKATPLPAGFNQWSSAVSLYYYHGLEKTDALGVKVYMESLGSHPWFYASKIAHSVGNFFANGLEAIRTFPTPSNPIGYKFLPADFNNSILGRSTIVPPTDRDRFVLEYYNPRETVASYGMRLIDLVYKLTSASWLYFVLNIVGVAGLFGLKSDLEKITAFSLLVSLVAFISASGMLVGLRHKEIISITPAYFLLVAITILGAASTIRQVAARVQSRVA